MVREGLEGALMEGIGKETVVRLLVSILYGNI